MLNPMKENGSSAASRAPVHGAGLAEPPNTEEELYDEDRSYNGSSHEEDKPRGTWGYTFIKVFVVVGALYCAVCLWLGAISIPFPHLWAILALFFVCLSWWEQRVIDKGLMRDDEGVVDETEEVEMSRQLSEEAEQAVTRLATSLMMSEACMVFCKRSDIAQLLHELGATDGTSHTLIRAALNREAHLMRAAAAAREVQPRTGSPERQEAMPAPAGLVPQRVRLLEGEAWINSSNAAEEGAKWNQNHHRERLGLPEDHLEKDQRSTPSPERVCCHWHSHCSQSHSHFYNVTLTNVIIVSKILCTHSCN
ncbi:unnamed protein product [Chrysoparadoxa australica]